MLLGLDNFLLTALTVIFAVLFGYILKRFRSYSDYIDDGKTKHVLVTGCDSGFGLSIALDLTEHKCKVFAGCLTQGGVDRLEKDENFDGFPFLMGVTKQEDVENARKFIEEKTENDGIMFFISSEFTLEQRRSATKFLLGAQ